MVTFDTVLLYFFKFNLLIPTRKKICYPVVVELIDATKLIEQMKNIL